MRQAIQPVGRQPLAPSRSPAAPKAWDVEFEAPTRGMVTNQNQAKPISKTALWLSNFFPTRTGLKPRGGTAKHATIGSTAVKAMFKYESGTTERLFAAHATAVYDITSPGDPDVAPTAAISSLTGGEWSTAQIAVSGGDYLVMVNGADTPRDFDGTTWSSSSMTGSGLTTSDLIHVWAYNSRLFFIESGSMEFWYLGVGNYTGTLSSYSLQGIFKKGGSLFMGGTWALDAGDGLGDFCIIISTKGEVAIFEGTDPSSASTWTLKGTYEIAEPLGKNAWMKAGGDFLVATVEGIIPISQAIRKDPAALSLSAITNAIEPTWLEEVADRRSLPFDITRWNEGNLAMVSTPGSGGQSDLCFIVNLETGGWTTYDWNAQCAAVYNERLYWGDDSGRIYEAENGGSDDGALYTCQMSLPFYSITRRNSLKTATLARAFFTSRRAFTPQLSLSSDYERGFPSAPSSPANNAVAVWDSGLWDTAVWDATSDESATTNWVEIEGEGDVLSPQLQMSFGVTFVPEVEFIKFQLQGHEGALVQ